MFSKSENVKLNFLEHTRAARKGRSIEKKMETASILIQAYVRGWLTRKKYTNMVLMQFDEVVSYIRGSTLSIQPAAKIFHVSSAFLAIWKKDRDRERFSRLCQYLISSLEWDSPKLSYVGLALNKEYVMRWIPQINNILSKCCDYLENLKPEVSDDSKLIVLYLHFLISFTSTSTWAIMKNKNMVVLITGMNQLCVSFLGQLYRKGLYVSFKKLLLKGLGRSKIVLKQVPLSAVLTLSIRQLVATDFSDYVLSNFLVHVMSVPALIRHLEEVSPESISLLVNHRLFYRILEHLSDQQSMRIVFNALEGNYALCLVANLIHLTYIERNNTSNSNLHTFIIVLGKLLQSCQDYVDNKQSNLTHWHPVLGWFAQPMDFALQGAMPHVTMQLHILWDKNTTQLLLESKLIAFTNALNANKKNEVTNSYPPTGNFFRKILDHHCKISVQKSDTSFKLPEVQEIVSACALYQTALKAFPQLRLDLLTGLCYENNILHKMWCFISSLGAKCGLKLFLDNFAENTKPSSELLTLQLFCDCMTHYITLLDDVEMYEQQKHFLLPDYALLTEFLNIFIYKCILNNYFDTKAIKTNSLFVSLHTLLLLLYQRDCRRTFTVPDHWLIKEIKISSFMADLEKNHLVSKLLIQNMPHIIPHEDRVKLFRRYVISEKTTLGLTESTCTSPQSTLITVHRARIIEDGYRQLALLPSQAMKGIIRVRFINKQGLDEAGIDQDGVFKEFLEESLKRIFDPGLNFFTVTSEEKLYPSPTSYLQDDYLQLFEFVGRLLGKAVYEGIVVDAPFAPFFLTQVCGPKAQALYSCIDELPSLDPELYRSLSYVKHYDGDVANLDLTFSINEEHLGKIITQELIPGGKVIRVTNENKINYIHTMAHFRMYVQIKDCAAAFRKGFRSIVNPDWLHLFSTRELQRLISGDNSSIDLKDLRKHTQYYGGFHDSHKIIGWLWDILDKDFTENERGMFLKFVTSCSRPPLLGFAYLEPPFSIRCVEVSDDEDGGDTVGSVFRGFFTIRRKDPQNRLPTSSTCFNLLKLPNYHKKGTLREKLRYAILSNTGFELS